MTIHQLNTNGFSAIVVIIIVVAIGIAGGLGFLGYSKVTGKDNTTSTSKAAPVKQVEVCSTQSCFETRFASCKASEFTASLGDSLESSAVVTHYEINGPSENGCNMTFSFTKNPNPAWQNKDLTCSFDNKQPFQQSVEIALSGSDAYGCSGPLLPLITS